jgi:hypothetical protein
MGDGGGCSGGGDGGGGGRRASGCITDTVSDWVAELVQQLHGDVDISAFSKGPSGVIVSHLFKPPNAKS